MAHSTAELANLVLAGLVAGNEFGGRVAVHPAIDGLPFPVRLAAEQALYRRYGRLMPVMMTSAVASGIPVLSGARDRTSAAFRLTVGGVACLVAMLAVTFLGNMPLNRRVLAFPPDGRTEDFAALRVRWDRFHTLRVALDLLGFALLCLGALTRRDQAGERRP